VYTPQEEMKHILFENPEARVDTLRKVFRDRQIQTHSTEQRDIQQSSKRQVKELKAKASDIETRKSELVSSQASLAITQEKGTKTHP